VEIESMSIPLKFVRRPTHSLLRLQLYLIWAAARVEAREPDKQNENAVRAYYRYEQKE